MRHSNWGHSSSSLISLCSGSDHQVRPWHHHFEVMRDEVEGSGGDFLFLLGLFLLFDLAISIPHFGDQLNHEGHDEIVHVEPPSILQCKVGLDILVASVQSGSEELFFLSLHKELHKLFDNLLVVGLLGCFDGVSVNFVLL